MSDWPDLLGPVEEVAPRLLGAVLRHGPVAVRLVEVEAYGGSDDPGSHAFRGPTPRSSIMFGQAGRLYCYLSYGMHVCLNVVVGHEGEAEAVLLRAGEVVDGHDEVRTRRPGARERDLARGPALFSRALGIDLTSNGADLASGPVRLERRTSTDTAYAAGPRVGLRGAADRPWRFWVPGSPQVSAYRRHPRAPDLAIQPDVS